MLSAQFLEDCIRIARDSSIDQNEDISPSSSLSSAGSDTASSAHSDHPDPHAVSMDEALQYYAGLPSLPVLLYRTGTEQWSAPGGPEAYHRLKELSTVFEHPIVDIGTMD